MNLFQLVFKQMRQRALGTWLTMLSVVLGVALAVSIFLMRQAGLALFGQTDYGYEVLFGVGQGSELDLTLNTVYHIYKSPGNMPYWVYQTLIGPPPPPPVPGAGGRREFNYNAHVHTAIPIAVGDTYMGRPIIGTPPKMFVSLQGLRDRIDDLRTKQAQLRGDVENAKPEEVAGFAGRQSELEKSLRELRGELKKLAVESTPVVEQPEVLPKSGEDQSAADPASTAPSTSPAPGTELLATSSKWAYGKPIAFKAEDAVDEAGQAAAELEAKHRGKAVAHQKAALADLDTIFYAVGAENGPLEYRPGVQYEMAEGRVFHAWRFEAVIGSEVAAKTQLKIGDKFHATHGNPGKNDIPDIHPELWQVVGVMKPTHTAADRCLYIPLVTFYCIAEHEAGIESQARAREGQASSSSAKPKAKPDDDDIPKFKDVYGDELDPDLPHEKGYIKVDEPMNKWLISAVMVKSRGGNTSGDLMFFVKSGGMHENVQAINPAGVMREFFETFFASSTTILLIIAAMVSFVAAVGILVSIYNSVSARNREIAILRALGATRGRVLVLICTEAGMIALFGAIIGLFVGHLLGGVASYYMSLDLGQGFDWISTSSWEWLYLVGVIVIALFAGLVPATKAYRTPVATNLVAA